MEINELVTAIQQADTLKRYGKVLGVVGLMIESLGPAANIGEVCIIHHEKDFNKTIYAEVVGFNHDKIILMPYTEVTEIGPGCLVESTNNPLTIKVGRSLIGNAIDALTTRLIKDHCLKVYSLI